MKKTEFIYYYTKNYTNIEGVKDKEHDIEEAFEIHNALKKTRLL
jgi:hypothetical protein